MRSLLADTDHFPRRHIASKNSNVLKTLEQDNANKMVVSLHVGTPQSGFVPLRVPLWLAQ